MVNGEDKYQHLTMMSNLADELEEARMSNVRDEDFMMTICFSIMGILQYANIIKIDMKSLVLERDDFINKLTKIGQWHKMADKRPSKLHIAMQISTKEKNKKGRKVRTLVAMKKDTSQMSADPSQEEYLRNGQTR